MNTIFVIIGVIIALLIFYALSRKITSSDSRENVPLSSLEVLEVKLLKQAQMTEEVQAPSLAAENLFAALHGLLREESNLQEHFSFEAVSNKAGGLRFYVVVPRSIVKYVENQIYAQYPDAQIKTVSDYAQDINFEDSTFEVATLSLERENFFPIKSFRDLEGDPLTPITSVLSQIDDEETIMLQYLVRPIPDVWQEAGYKYTNALREGKDISGRGPSIFGTALKTLAAEATGIAAGVATGWFKYNETSAEAGKFKEEVVRLTPTEELQVQAVENKLDKMGFEVEIRVVSASQNIEKAENKLRLVLASFQQLSNINLNSFKSQISVNKNAYLNKYKQRLFEPDNAFILNVEELATVFHLPSGGTPTPNISWVYSRKTEPPANLPTKDCVYIGETVFRSKRVKFGLDEGDDRLRHMYVIGKSGTGKSTLFESMISQDIVNGHGVCILDPHGETIEKVLDRIPDHRLDDIIYFDAADTERPIGLNLLQIEDPSQKNLLASGLVSAIKQHFDFSWGPRLEYLLNYAVLTLLEVPGTTLLGVTRLLEDKNYQNFILHFVKDPVVKRFWETEFKEMKSNQKLVTEAIAPIQNKVNRFLASSTIRNILGQKKSTIDLWEAMNSGKVLLINLSKGKIGADNANLLGALLVSRIQFYALQRANIPYDQRRPFYLYVDEFQNFATGSFEEILSESRKYKLGLYLTHQFTAQLPEEMLKGVYGNVGTIAAFSLGAPDATALSTEFAPYFTAEDIISLGRFEIYIKLMVKGMTSIPFSGRILLPWLEEEAMVPKTGNREKAIALSRQKYGSDRAYVEDKTRKWVEAQFDKGMAIALENKLKMENDQNF